MSKIKTFFKLLKNNRRGIKIALFDNLVHIGFYNRLSDERFLKKSFKIKMNKELNLQNPTTYNEKLQWLKIYDRKPEYSILVDKYLVRDFVAKTIGEEYLIPLLGKWDNAKKIDFNSLPNRFVLKCNHDSGSVCICEDKNSFNFKKVTSFLNKSLKKNLFFWSREWPYKNVQPCIIAEEYMEDKQMNELRDYKFFCFNGVVKAMFIAQDRQKKNEETKFDFFDENFNHLSVVNGHPNAKIIPEKPKNFELMKMLASKLSNGIPHVRVDFYECDNRVYFGEMTFFHWSGMVPFVPESWDELFGEWIDLPKKTVN